VKSFGSFAITMLSLCVLGGCAIQSGDPADESSWNSTAALETDPSTASDPTNPGEERMEADPRMPGPTPWRNRASNASNKPNPGPEVENTDVDPGMPGPTPWKNISTDVNPFL